MKMKKVLLSAIVASCLGAFATAALGQARVVVKFPKGKHEASAKGSIKGYTYIDYVLGARAGQHMSLELSSPEGKAQFVVRGPDNENLEYGTGVQEWAGELQQSGNYTVRILMSRAEARRKGAASSFIIRFTIK